MKRDTLFKSFGVTFGVMWVLSAMLGTSMAILIVYILYLIATWLSQNVN